MQPQQPYQIQSKQKTYLIPFILAVVVCILLMVFGIWAFLSRTDYKNNVDQKIATAVEVAKLEESTKKDNEFSEKEKSPTKTYVGPEAYGSVKFEYPKTWSGYVLVNDTSDKQIDGYFNKGVVPDISGSASFATRVQIVDSLYSEVLTAFDSQVEIGKVKVSAYKPVNVPGATATKLTGEIAEGKTGTLILIKLRDKTLQVWTESDNYTSDFNNFVLKTLTFAP